MCHYLYKTRAARLTFVWLLSWVDASVSLEVSWSVKLSTTDITAIRLLPWKHRNNQRYPVRIQEAQKKKLHAWRAVNECVRRTRVDSLVAGQVALVAESSLAAVALVWLVAVHLKHVLFQRFVFGELGVTFVTEERAVFCWGGVSVEVNTERIISNLYLSLMFNSRHKPTTAGVWVFGVQLRHVVCETGPGGVGTDFWVLWGRRAAGWAVQTAQVVWRVAVAVPQRPLKCAKDKRRNTWNQIFNKNKIIPR